MDLCACNGTLINTGVPNKQRVIDSGVKLFLQPMKADDGTLNSILATDTIDQTYIDGKVFNADPSKRWYPVGTFKNQEDLRGDPITESLTDGSSIITQQGVRSYTGVLLDYAAKYIHNLESFKCVDFGVFAVESCGQLSGSLSKDETELYPIRVEKSSWNPTLMKGTPTVKGKVQLQFEFAMIEKDKNLRVISNAEITGDLLNAEGPVEVKGTVTAPATTGFVIDIAVDYDIFLDASKTPVEGLVIADFVLTNLTTGAPIVITTVTEGAAGSYTFVIPAQTAADVLEVIIDISIKPFNLLETVTIP